MLANSLSVLYLAVCWLSSSRQVAARADSPATTTYSDPLDCTSFFANITAEADNFDLSILGKPDNQQSFLQTFIDLHTVNSPLLAKLQDAPPVRVHGTHSLRFEFCYPTHIPTRPSLLLLSHGIVANAGYWNLPGEGSTGTLSFVKAAAEAGYATLSYDRLCAGQSDHPDGTAVCQMPYEAAQAAAISAAIRNGSIDIGAWDSVVGIGHSFGSGVLFGSAGRDPAAFDALILTGITLNLTIGALGIASFQPTIASEVNSTRWGDLPTDYLTTGSVSGDQAGFVHYPNYANETLRHLTETKSTVTVGQLLSNFNGGGLGPALDYTNPLMVVTGEFDAILCTGDCLVTSLGPNKTQLDTAPLVFPAVLADQFATFVLPGSGHGINLHNNAFDAYEAIINFLLARDF